MFKESLAQTKERKAKVCSKCRYHILLSGEIVCDYIEVMKRSRPCPGYLCVERGVFAPIPKRRSRYRSWKEPEKAKALTNAEKKVDKPKTKNQLYYEARKEKVKQYYQGHKEEIKARTKEWKKAHPESVAEHNRRRKRAPKSEAQEV